MSQQRADSSEPQIGLVLDLLGVAGDRCSVYDDETVRAAVAKQNESQVGRTNGPVGSPPMASWQDFVQAAPEFAPRVEALFMTHKHHTMATVRKDGAPRISGTEIDIVSGELCLGMMPATLRAADLRRDPRIAIHSHSVDPPEGNPGAWTGEAKLFGRAVELTAGGQGSGRFRVDVEQVVLTWVDSGVLVIETWTPERGVVRSERD